jgi:hypothetical protein
MSQNRVTVEQWITEALRDPDKGKDCSGLALVHLKAGGVGQEEVHAKPISGPQDFRALAQFFIAKACGHAQDLPGQQFYKLLAFYGSQEPQASFTFAVFEGNLAAGDKTPWSKHDPSQTGLLAQLMKHNETLMGFAVQVVQGVAAGSFQRDIAHQQEKAEMTVILRDVLLNMKKEEREARMEQLKFERESAERQMLGRALPSMLNYATGREIIPESHADSQIIESLGLRVTPEHLQLMVGMKMITQEESLLLAARFTKIREEHEKKQAALRQAPSEDFPPKPQAAE